MANPILNEEKFLNQEKVIENTRILDGTTMTVNGTLEITAILGLIVVASAAFVWTRFGAGYTDLATMLTFGGAIVGFILALIVSFTRIKYLIPVYAVCEGCALGGISFMFEGQFPGIVAQAVGATFATLFTMLILHRAGLIKATEKFRKVIIIATLSIAAVYSINLIGHFFGYSVPLISAGDNSTAGIIVTAVIAVIAALNLIIDFDFIERGTEAMLPKDYEWYGAFGLMLTIVWLYLEILKLLAKLNSRK